MSESDSSVQARLASLERVVVSHTAQLLDHGQILTEQAQSLAELKNLRASNERIENLLVRVLEFVTPGPR